MLTQFQIKVNDDETRDPPRQLIINNKYNNDDY